MVVSYRYDHKLIKTSCCKKLIGETTKKTPEAKKAEGVFFSYKTKDKAKNYFKKGITIVLMVEATYPLCGSMKL
jgi:hypothetical protein